MIPRGDTYYSTSTFAPSHAPNRPRLCGSEFRRWKPTLIPGFSLVCEARNSIKAALQARSAHIVTRAFNQKKENLASHGP